MYIDEILDDPYGKKLDNDIACVRLKIVKSGAKIKKRGKLMINYFFNKISKCFTKK